MSILRELEEFIKDLEDCIDMQEHELNECKDTIKNLEEISRDLLEENIQLRVQKARLENDFDEERMDIIGQNGNDGLHYAEWEGDPPMGYRK